MKMMELRHDQELESWISYQESDLVLNSFLELKEHSSLTLKNLSEVVLRSHQEFVWAALKKTDAPGLLKELNLVFCPALFPDLGPVGRFE